MRNHGFRESIRSVTQEEIASFRENGWAYLPGLLACEIAEKLHAQGEHLQRAQTQPLSCKPRRKTDLEDRVGKAFQSYLADDQAVELAAFAVSPVMGRNAAVHHSLTVHGAPPNQTEQPRWAYAYIYFDADARYSGAADTLLDGVTLKTYSLFDHPAFPLVPIT